MASAPKLPSDVTSSLAEKGQKPKSPITVPFTASKSSSTEESVAVPVSKTDEEKGHEILARAMGIKIAGKKSRKHKKRAHKKTQKRRARK